MESDDERSIVSEALERILPYIEEARERGLKELGYRLGMEPVTHRYVRGLARRARRGDEGAMIKLRWLYDLQPFTPNPMDPDIEFVLEEEG